MKNDRNFGFMQYLALFALLIMQCGCASSELPPKLSESEKQILKQAEQFPVVVAVAEYKYPVYSERLVKHLKETELFKNVGRVGDEGIRADLIARVEDTVYGTATMPIVTMLTLGIVPTGVQEEWGNDFSLSIPDSPNYTVRIPYRYSTESVLGWKALFLNMSSNWSMKHYKSSRYRDRFTLALLTNSTLIEIIQKTQPVE